MADPRADVKARMTRSLFGTRGEDGNRMAHPVHALFLVLRAGWLMGDVQLWNSISPMSR